MGGNSHWWKQQTPRHRVKPAHCLGDQKLHTALEHGKALLESDEMAAAIGKEWIIIGSSGSGAKLPKFEFRLGAY